MVKFIKISVAVLTVVCIFSLSVYAEDISCDEEYKAMLDALPSDISSLLPDKLFSSNINDISDGAEEVLSFGYIADAVMKTLGLCVKDALKLLARILGVLVLAAVMNTVKASFSSSGVSNAFSICASCAVFLVAVSAQAEVISSTAEYFSRLCIFANTVLPLGGALYAMGGNVAGAVVHHSSLTFFMVIVENLCAKTALPVCGICMALSAVNTVAPEMNISGISGFFKKTYTSFLGLVMTVFITVMGTQSLLASKADNVSSKAAKFAIGNMIPTVGSALSNTFGAVSSSVEYIRASVGAVGIVAIILMVVPTILTLLVTKLAFSLLIGAADILGCKTEEKVLSELSGINGFLLAAAAITAVCFIFIMTIFAKCTSALGGGVI